MTAVGTSTPTGAAAGPAPSRSRAARAVSDGWTMTRRDLMHWAMQPVPVIIGLCFPVLMVLMFGYLFGGSMSVPGGGDYREFLLPGLFVMTVVFGLEGTMMAIATDATKGVTDRFRSMPMAPSAVVVGRGAADLINSVVGLAVMLAVGLLVGWRWRDGVAAAGLAVALLILLRLALVWVGIYLGLLAKRPEAVVAVQILVWPFGFLSNAFVGTDAMPAWLGTIAEWNPISATVSATRQLFGNPGLTDSWIGQHSVLMAVGWPLILLAIFAPLAIRRYQHLGG